VSFMVPCFWRSVPSVLRISGRGEHYVHTLPERALEEVGSIFGSRIFRYRLHEIGVEHLTSQPEFGETCGKRDPVPIVLKPRDEQRLDGVSAEVDPLRLPRVLARLVGCAGLEIQ
jgi:hypothetical protein